MDHRRLMEETFDDYQELHIDIENVHFTLMTDCGAVTAGTDLEDENGVLHFHSFYEIFYVRSGNLEFNLEEGKYRYGKDNLIIVPPRILHKTSLENNDSSRYCIYLFFEKNNVRSEVSLYDMLKNIFSDGCMFLEETVVLQESVKNLTESLAAGNRLKALLHLYELLIGLIEILGGFPRKSAEEILSDSSLSRTYKIQRIISKYYMQDISLEMIAKNLHLSTRQVNRIVQAHYKCTYREIISRTKIKAAAKLLASDKMTVSAIAEKVGYRSLKGFYAAFKKQYGCHPTEYKRLLENKTELKTGGCEG